MNWSFDRFHGNFSHIMDCLGWFPFLRHYITDYCISSSLLISGFLFLLNIYKQESVFPETSDSLFLCIPLAKRKFVFEEIFHCMSWTMIKNFDKKVKVLTKILQILLLVYSDTDSYSYLILKIFHCLIDLKEKVVITVQFI